jgi:hypothetical protein
MIASDGHLLEILIPSFARIEAKLVIRFAEQSIPSALYVIGGKGLAVMPFDPLVEPKTQFGFG